MHIRSLYSSLEQSIIAVQIFEAWHLVSMHLLAYASLAMRVNPINLHQDLRLDATTSLVLS